MAEKVPNYIKKIKDSLVTDSTIFRFGSIGDGGYYLRPNTLKNSKVLFSGGISSNLEFEHDIFRFNKEIKILMLDPTVSKAKLLFKGVVRFFFPKPEKIRYLINALLFSYLSSSSRCVHKKIFLNKDYSILNLIKSTFDVDSGILLKLDIEGSEYDFLDEITENLNSFSAMVFEFHDMNEKHHLVEDFILKCQSHFNLVYLAENPSGGYDAYKRPKNIEITLERRKNL
jgi:hypothetical protein